MGFPGKERSLLIIILTLIIVSLMFITIKEQGLPRLPDSREIISRSEFFMDTAVTIKVVTDKNKDEATQIIFRAFQHMKDRAHELDRYVMESSINRINNADGKEIEVYSWLVDLLLKGKDYSELSDGAFDPTIAPLIDLWRFGKDKQRVPLPYEIKETLQLIDYHKIELDQAHNRVLLPSKMALDLGGMAKGYIVDQGIEFLRSSGIDSAYINGGGNIRVMGMKRPDHPWQLGIRQPRQPGVYNQYILALNQGSLSTSGDYERYFIEDGIRYSHLLDPRTGYPAREMQAATVYAPTALEADILSTTVFILGWDRGKRLIESLVEVEGFLVREGEIWQSRGFNSLLSR